jgi:hypothetical protein
MLVFPQLLSGAVTQWPVRRTRETRTVVNETLDGTRLKIGDPGADAIVWELTYPAITDSERSALWDLFSNCEGRLSSFTFLDPLDNLLCWSGNLDETVWSRSSLLTVTSSVADPLGGPAATRLHNTSGAALRIEQIVNGPAWFQYAFSVWARSTAPGSMTLSRQATGTADSKVIGTDGQWRRFVLSGNFSNGDESVQFGLELPAGATVEVYGLQVEAQAGASSYKDTHSRGGVYPDARFAEDTLGITAEGPNRHSCTLRVFSRT